MTHAIIVAILYFGYRLSFAVVDAAATGVVVVVITAALSASQLLYLFTILLMSLYVPFNYDYNVYEQNNQYKKNAHALTFLYTHIWLKLTN